jgi:T5SS/PEP-CTERM-associated repeat protein
MRTKRFIAVALAIFAAGAATPATAANKFWKNSVGSGVWTNGNNWSAISPNGVDNAGVPGAGDDVKIDINLGGAPRTVTYDYPGPPITLNSLGVNNTSATAIPATLSMAANNLTTGELDVGWSGFGGFGGAGTFTQSGGVTTVNGAGLYVGVNGTDIGTCNLSGTASLVASTSEVVGSSGTGVFNQTGGTNTMNAAGFHLYLGSSAGSTGTYNLSGAGALAAQSEYVGYSGTGIFNQTGGTNTIGGFLNRLYLGYNAGSTGTYTISGGTLTVGNDLVVGNSATATGTLTIQNNGSVYVTNDLWINSQSSVNLNGGTLRFNTISGGGGLSRLNYVAGIIQLLGDHSYEGGSLFNYFFDNGIPSGKGAIIEGDFSLYTSLSQQSVTEYVVNGGSLSSANLWLGTEPFHPAYLRIVNGGRVSTTGAILGLDSDAYYTSVTVSGPGSSLSAGHYLAVGEINDAILNILDQGLVYTGQLSIGLRSIINLNGGTLRFSSIENRGTFNYSAGTIQLSGSRNIGSDTSIDEVFGGAPTITSGKGLTVEGTATLLTTVTLDGGTLTAPNFVNGQYLNLQRGTLNVTSQAITIGTGGLLGSALDVNEDMTVNVTLGITNQGLVTGDGQIGGTFANAAAGELRAQAGRALRLTGANNTNAGQIKLFGGELEFTQNLTNNAGALVSGNGSLIVGGGLVNQGTMNFAGTANIDGDVTNAPGGKIISGGGGATVFYDDVINNGEIRTSTNGFTVFFGSVSGVGSFAGTGTVNFEGDLAPGNSPAAISFGGDVVFGRESKLVLEIGGVTAGSQYDQINVAGTLTLDGTLQISLINGFTPALGDEFNLFSFTSSSGNFANYEGLTVGGHLELNGSFGAGGLLLTARPAIDGDINLDGTVNIFDINSVSANWGAAGPQGDANGDGIVNIFDVNLISSNWGASGAAAVPEPAGLALFLLGALVAPIAIRRRQRKT